MNAHARRLRVLLFVLMAGTLAAVSPHAQQPKPYSTWTQYGGASDSMQYSALSHINKSNVKQLRPAWFYHVAGEPQRIVFNPIVVDNVMYVAGADGNVVALDPATGKEIWVSTLRAPDRGVTYWESKDRSDRRLILTASNGIRAIDARTGRQIPTFGNNGFVDMRAGFPRRLGGPNSSPGRIFENLVIVGSNTGELYGSPPGDIRAYDVITGKLVWTFHTIPRPGEYGYETWPKDAYRYAGGANVWGDITVDDKNGIVFLPTGSPTYDLYGGDRRGDNLFGNCLLALDARTGKRLWHFQMVHHDVWDYDNTSPPKLLTVQHNGKSIDIVAQAGKTGFLYVFERKTGKPLWPIEERPVSKSLVPGEFSSPTQPFPTKPPPFARQSMTPEDVTPFVSAEEQEKLKQLVREAANEGLFTPPNHERFAIQFPGAWGGANLFSSAGILRRAWCTSGATSRSAIARWCRSRVPRDRTSRTRAAAAAEERRLRSARASRRDRPLTWRTARAVMVPGRCRFARSRRSGRSSSARSSAAACRRCRRSPNRGCQTMRSRRSSGI